jgi:hypothetical protein
MTSPNIAFPREIVPLATETNRVHSPLSLRLVDTMTGQPPFGGLRFSVDVSDGQGGWIKVDRPPVRVTPSSILTMPGFGRTASAADSGDRLFRFRLEAEYYHPVYPPPTSHPVLIPPPQPPATTLPISTEAFRFVVYPYDDSTPPQSTTQGSSNLNLYPASNYPYSNELEVLHGRVVTGAAPNQQPLARAEVESTNTPPTVFTDNDGWFALSFPRFTKTPPPIPFNLTVRHPASGQGLPVTSKQFPLTYPTAFEKSQTFQLP